MVAIPKDHSPKLIIAIDGHSSCGKSTLAKQLAESIGYYHIDTGAMYRAITLYFLDQDVDITIADEVKKALKNLELSLEQINEVHHLMLNGKIVSDRIRKPDVANRVSEVAALPMVRAYLLQLQRNIGAQKGIIMDGRDIGTVIFPDAELKLFVTASLDIRSERRYAELVNKGISTTRDEVKQNLAKRDYIDQNRDVAPLKMAEDAILIDTSDMSKTEQLAKAKELVKQAIGSNA